jgi:hypothetical protein
MYALLSGKKISELDMTTIQMENNGSVYYQAMADLGFL